MDEVVVEKTPVENFTYRKGRFVFTEAQLKSSAERAVRAKRRNSLRGSASTTIEKIGEVFLKSKILNEAQLSELNQLAESIDAGQDISTRQLNFSINTEYSEQFKD